MDYTAQLAGYTTLINQLVGSKVAPDSVDPTDVVTIGKALADLLLPILNGINDFAITGGTLPPDNANGIDLDLYIQGGTSLTFWRKRNGIWSQEAVTPLGIQIIDGNITLQASVNDQVVTVSAGSWGINNIVYSKAVQTQLNLTAADLNFNRIDTILANTSGDVLLLNGVASSNPDPAALPANSIVVAYVYIPASSSGDLPYISDSNSSPSTIIDDAIVSLVKTWSSAKINRMPQPWSANPTPLHGVRWYPIDGIEYLFRSEEDGNTSEPSLESGIAAWTDLESNGDVFEQWDNSTPFPVGELVQYFGITNGVYRSKSTATGHNPESDVSHTYWDIVGYDPVLYVIGDTYALKQIVLDEDDSYRRYVSNVAANDYALDGQIAGTWQVIGYVPAAPLTFDETDLIEVYEGNYSLSFNLPEGKSIASIETKAGTVTRHLSPSQAVTDTANNPNTIIEGFDNNGAQTITIKLI